jgi:hypothetical protein
MGGRIYTIEPSGRGMQQLTQIDEGPDPGGRPTVPDRVYGRGSRQGLRDERRWQPGNEVNLSGARFRGRLTDRLVYECGDCSGGRDLPDDGRRSDAPASASRRTPSQTKATERRSPDGMTVTTSGTRSKGNSSADRRRHRWHERADDHAIQGRGWDRSTTGRRTASTSWSLWADFPHGHSPNVATVRPDGSGLRMLTSIANPDMGPPVPIHPMDAGWVFRHRTSPRRLRTHEDARG